MDVTPHDLRNAELREAFRGYRPEEVEELLERAAVTLERMHERNRQLLEKWRANPEHSARLQQELRAFQTLPPERQEQLRRLDRALREENSATSARLQRVLEHHHGDVSPGLWSEITHLLRKED